MEPPIKDLPTLLSTLLPVMMPLLDKPFVLLGYSMGARIALELARRLHLQNGPKPRGLIVAAAPPPAANDREPMHLLDDAHFIEKLRSYEGTPEEILQNRELLELVVPTLRADFALAWWENGAQAVKLDLPLSVLGGTGDKHVTPGTLERWRDETSGEVRMREFPGGHFFIRTHPAPVLAAVREDLGRWWPASPA
jgi:surfactin synthase thioesterase subunit